MWLIIVGVLFVSGILYYVFARSMPPIVLGITIGCGAVLLFYVIRLIRNKLQDKTLRGIDYSMSFKERSKEGSASDYGRRLEEWMRREDPSLDYTYTPMFPEPKVVSTEKVVCRRISGELHTALLLIHEDGSVTVKCSGDCSDCEYGDVE